MKQLCCALLKWDFCSGEREGKTGQLLTSVVSLVLLEGDPGTPPWSGLSLNCQRAAHFNDVSMNGSPNSEMSKTGFGFLLVTTCTRPSHETSPTAEQKCCLG